MAGEARLRTAGRARPVAILAPLVAVASWWFTRGLGLPFPPWPPGGVFGRWHPLLFGFNLGVTVLALLAVYVFWAGDTKRRAGNAALALFAPILMLGLLELPALFGWIDYRQLLNTEIDWTPWEGEHNRLDDELIHIHPPYDRIQGQTTGDLTAFGVEPVRRYDIDYQYDRNGFRNTGDYDSAAVVLSGDSFLEGLLTPVDEAIGARLEAKLGRPVYNLGQSNWGPSHQVPALRRFGLPLEPETVVWFFFEGNDLKDVGVYAGTLGNFEDRVKRYDRFGKRSFVRNALWFAALLTNRDDRLERRRSCEIDAPGGSGSARLYFLYPGESLTARDDSLFTVAQTEMLLAREMARAVGSDFVLAFVPTKFRVYQDLCSWIEESDLEGWEPNDLNGQLKAFADEHEIPYVDLTVSLRAASAGGVLTYFEDDTHWTPAGHDVASDAVLERLGSLEQRVPLGS